MNRTIRILLVDCDTEFRQRLVSELGKEGIEVEIAVGRSELFDRLQASPGRHDLVMLGEFEHPEQQQNILKEIQQGYPSLDVIRLTDTQEAWQNNGSDDQPRHYTAERHAAAPLLAHAIRSMAWQRSARIRSQALLSAPEPMGMAKDEDQLYQQLHEEASALLPGLDGFVIAQYDAQSNEVSFPFAYKHDRRIHIQSRTGGNGFAEYILLTKKSMLLPYGDEMVQLQLGLTPPDPSLGYSRSEIVVPMFLDDGKVYGVVFASTDNPNIHYTLGHLQLLTAFTRKAALAIRHFLELKEAYQLRDATAALAGERGREGVLRAIVTGAHKIVNSSFTGLILLDEDGRLRKVQPVIPEDFFDRFGEARQEGGLTRAVIAGRRPVIIPDTSQHPLVKESVRQAGIRSMLVLPLIHRDRVLGVLYTHTLTLRDFGARDIALWSAFATQAASALDRALEEERQLRDYQHLIRNLDQLDEHLSLPETLTRVATIAKQIFASDTCRLFYIDAPTGNIVSSAWAEGDDEIFHVENEPRARGSTQYVLRTKRPFYYPSTQGGPKQRAELLAAGLQSSASLPLRYGGRDIGVLHCNYFKRQAIFNEHYQTLLEAFGTRAAVAIHRAARERTTEIWRDLDREIVNCTDIHQLYQLFTQRAHEALGADFSIFYPYDPISVANGRLPLHDECVCVGELRSRWRPPRGGRKGGVFKEIARRQPLLIVNDLKGTRYSSHLAKREAVKAFVAMRLEVILPETREPNLAGVLFVNYRRRAALTETDLVQLKSASELIAVNILRLRLQSDLQTAFKRSNAQLRAVIEIFKTHESKHRDLNLDHIAQRAAEALGLDVCTILEFDPNLQKFKGRGNYGLLQPEYDRITLRSRFKDAYLHRDGPIVIPDVRKDPLMRVSKFVQREHIRSTVVYPLRIEGEALGLLFGNYRRPTAPSTETLEALGLFADVAAQVLRQADLNSRLSEKELREERHRLLVWVSMVEDMWQHTLVLKASSIRNHIFTLLQRLKNHPRLPDAMDAVPDILREMDRLATDIANAPPRVPLESEMLEELIPIGPLLLEFAAREQRSNRLRGDSRHLIEMQVKKLGGVQVYGYRRWLIYALESVFQNAYKAMPKGGQISVHGSKHGQWVEIRIQDTGKGVPRHLRDKIFKQAITGKRKHSGLGIGSVLATTLMEENGGSIELEKPGPGDTTVLLRLPIVRQAGKT